MCGGWSWWPPPWCAATRAFTMRGDRGMRSLWNWLRYGLQRTYAMRGPDVEGETPEVQGALMLQANDILKRLGGRWMLQSEAQRRRVAALPAVAWRYPVAALIDQERRRSLLEH